MLKKSLMAKRRQYIEQCINDLLSVVSEGTPVQSYCNCKSLSVTMTLRYSSPIRGQLSSGYSARCC